MSVFNNTALTLVDEQSVNAAKTGSLLIVCPMLIYSVGQNIKLL